MDVSSRIMELLWIGGLAATPVALVVGVICRMRSLRPATRHVLWLSALASFLTPMLGAVIWRPEWFRSDRVIAATDSVLKARGVDPASTTYTTPEADRAGSAPVLSNAGGPADVRRHGVDEAGRSGGPGRPIDSFRAPMIASDPVASARMSPANRERAAGSLDGTTPHRREQPKTSPRPAPRVAMDTGIPEQSSAGAVRSVPIVDAMDDRCVERPDHRPANRTVQGRSPDARMNSRSFPASEGIAANSAKLGDEDLEALDLMGTTSGIVKLLVGAAAREAGLAPASPGKSTVDAAAPRELEAARATTKVPSDQGGVRAWVTSIVGVRDSIASMPPMPAPVWLGVAAALVLLALVRAAVTARWLRGARAAGADVEALVRDVASGLGLARPPRVVVVDSAVSPMIWCGLRPRLVLPSGLWRTLDEDSRRAVVAHELAHVRRWDHVMCWLELVIGAVYWWHPVMWWARQRLHDEAEASCDAWVTSLLPGSRRAYASALVTTKTFLSSREPSAGACLGIMSGSAKRLARRITMVMTQRTAPKLSVVGACAASLVLAVGMFVTPGLACPPEESAKTTKRGEKAPNADAPAVEFFGEAPALEAMKGGQAAAPSAFAPTLRLISPRAVVSGQPAQGVVLYQDTTPQPSRPAQARSPKAPKPPKAPKAPKAAKAADSAAATTTWSGDLEELKIGRTPKEYALPEGKLGAFYELMSRNDVPVLVQMQGDSIIIWATEEQHPVFKAFVKMINPGESKGKAKVRTSSVDGEAMRRAELAYAAAANGKQVERARLTEYMQALKQLQDNHGQMEVQADKMREEAEVVRERAQELRDLSQELRERASEQSEEQARATLMEAYGRLKNRSEALTNESRSMDDRVESILQRIEDLERRAEELEEQISAAEGEGMEIDDADELAALDAMGELVEIEIPDVIEVPVEIEVIAPEAPVDVAPAADPTQLPPAPPAPPAAPSAPAPAPAPAAPPAPPAPPAPAPGAR